MGTFLGLTRAARLTALRALFPNATTRYIALLTDLGTATDGSDIVEAAGSGYARAACNAWTDAHEDEGGGVPDFQEVDNTNEIAFPVLTDPLGPIKGFAIFDAAMGGNVLAIGQLLDGAFAPIERSFVAGDTPTYPAHTLAIALNPDPAD